MSAPPERKTPAGWGAEAGAGISVAWKIQCRKYNETDGETSAKTLTDDIDIFCPDISDEEYDIRAKLRSVRNMSAAMIPSTDSYAAGNLAMLASEYANAYIYACVPINELSDVALFCGRLMKTAMQGEAIDDRGRA